jgi:hypothetical protein
MSTLDGFIGELANGLVELILVAVVEYIFIVAFELNDEPTDGSGVFGADENVTVMRISCRVVSDNKSSAAKVRIIHRVVKCTEVCLQVFKGIVHVELQV